MNIGKIPKLSIKYFQAYILFISSLFSVLHAETIHHTGYWCGMDVTDKHWYDSKLAEAIANFLKEECATTVADFGCGMGNYVRCMRSKGFTCDGFDGNPFSPQLSQGCAEVQDLSEPFDLGKKYDWIISLEVGEHLPAIFEDVFVFNLDRHCRAGIVLSWAVEGQEGFGHFNCRNNDYIKAKMQNLGYINDLDAEKYLRRNSTLRWFKNTIMVFRKIAPN